MKFAGFFTGAVLFVLILIGLKVSNDMSSPRIITGDSVLIKARGWHGSVRGEYGINQWPAEQHVMVRFTNCDGEEFIDWFDASELELEGR